jgi:hypothetical protein
MNYRLSRKNEQGKWWTYGDFKLNKYNNYSASFKVSALEELIAMAKKEGSAWVNLSAFQEEEKQQSKPAHDYKTTPEVSGANTVDDFEDDIPF